MSTHKVEIVKIVSIEKHPNADRLEIAKIEGWQVVIGKGTFVNNDVALYIPVDSLLPESLETRLFPPDSKIKLYHHRIRSIKIRGQMSQGMLVPIEEVDAELNARNLDPSSFDIGTDFSEILGIVKYEPPEPEFTRN